MKINIDKFLGNLGYKVKDKITGYIGVIIGVNFDLHGCIQYDIRPVELDKDGKIRTGHWIDVNRVDVISSEPLMEQPQFCFKNETDEEVEGNSEKTSKYDEKEKP